MTIRNYGESLGVSNEFRSKSYRLQAYGAGRDGGYGVRGVSCRGDGVGGVLATMGGA